MKLIGVLLILVGLVVFLFIAFTSQNGLLAVLAGVVIATGIEFIVLGSKRKEAHPFKIEFDKRFDPDGLNIRANFSKMLTREEQKNFLASVIAWSEKDCPGDVYLDLELEWYEGTEGIWAEMYTDLIYLEGKLEDAFEALWDRFDAFPQITSVMVGSGNELWPLPPEEN